MNHIRPGIGLRITNTLTVTALDQTGNFSSQSVTFETAASIDSLKKLVKRFTDSGLIDNKGTANSLQVKLDHGSLNAFIHEVNAQSGKHISKETAQYLLRDARSLMKTSQIGHWFVGFFSGIGHLCGWLWATFLK